MRRADSLRAFSCATQRNRMHQECFRQAQRACHGTALAPGDNVVYCPGFDHPNATYAWLNLGHMGVECRPVPLLADGRLDLAAVLRATDSRTRLVTVASVNFLSGMRAELGEIGHHCRRAGIFFLVDGAQSAGVLDVDVEEASIDGWCASANKGLLGPYGVGFAYCREEIARQLRPVYLSRFGVNAGHLPESEMGSPHYDLYAGARRLRSAMRIGPGSSQLPPPCANWGSSLNRPWSGAQWTSLRGLPRACGTRDSKCHGWRGATCSPIWFRLSRRARPRRPRTPRPAALLFPRRIFKTPGLDSIWASRLQHGIRRGSRLGFGDTAALISRCR